MLEYETQPNAALLLAAEQLEYAVFLIADWGSYAPLYYQEKHDLQGDIEKIKSHAKLIRNMIREPAKNKKLIRGGDTRGHHKKIIGITKMKAIILTESQLKQLEDFNKLTIDAHNKERTGVILAQIIHSHGYMACNFYTEKETDQLNIVLGKIETDREKKKTV